MRNYRDISYILNERGFNVHHLTPSKLLSPHTEFLVLLMIRLCLSVDDAVFITNIFDCYSSNSFYFLYEAKRNSVIVRAALIARKACLVSGL